MKKQESNTGCCSTKGINSAESLFKKSIACIKKEHFRCAAEALKKAVQIKPDYIEAYCLPGDLYIDAQAGYQAFFPEPEEIFRKVISLDPDYVVAYHSLGFIYSLWDGRHSDAAWAYREALRINPNSGFAHHNLGLALRSLEHLEEAAAEFQEAIRTLSDAEQLDEAHFELGRTYLGLCNKQYGILKERKYFRASALLKFGTDRGPLRYVVPKRQRSRFRLLDLGMVYI